MSDGAKVQFGRRGAVMRTESMMLYERSRPLKANREDVDLTACKGRPPITVSIDPIDLWAIVTGTIDRAIASSAVLLTMRPRLSL
jgi:hypothetical protein